MIPLWINAYLSDWVIAFILFIQTDINLTLLLIMINNNHENYNYYKHYGGYPVTHGSALP